MKLRQIALVSSDLAKARKDFFAVLGLREDFADPLVNEFGLKNSVMAVGNSFIEVVSPQNEQTAAARFLERNGGDGGYMLIVQTDSIAKASTHIEQLGIRKIWELNLDNASAFHMHPKDTDGGAMLSFDEMNPPESWAWGGPDWEQRRAEYAGDITAVEVEATDAEKLAARWAEIFQTQPREISGGYRVPMDGGEIRILQNNALAVDRISALELRAIDRERALKAAGDSGLDIQENCIQLCGIAIKLV